MKRNLFAALLLGTAVLVYAQSPPTAKPRPTGQGKASAASPAVKITEVEGITEYRLANGLQVLLFPDPTKPTVTVNVTYKVGSRQENYGETGMAHLLEHLMFKGCTRHRNIPQELTTHGTRPNGSTSYDRTNYFEIFQASEENLRWALDLEADRMVHSFISKTDLDSEMTVVRNEFEAGENDPESILTERVLSTAYLWHAYGRSPIGARSDIERVPIERLQAFYRTYYQPDNAVLLVAGRFEEKKTLGAIVSTFGAIPKPRRVLPEPYTAEPTQDGERSVTLRRVGDVQALAVAYHVPSGSHPDAAPLQLLAEILAATPSGRLYKSLVEGQKASSVSDYFPLLHDAGFLMFQAEVRQESSLAEAEKTTRETIDAILKSPAAKEELDRARAQLLKDIDLTLNSSQRVGL
ncbi:MAG TPA: pitrilysin family protein, partial [Thermoanaerobaculia bacterium]